MFLLMLSCIPVFQHSNLVSLPVLDCPCTMASLINYYKVFCGQCHRWVNRQEFHNVLEEHGVGIPDVGTYIVTLAVLTDAFIVL